MKDGWSFGYCTNVHSGTTLDAVRENLKAYSLSVKEKFCPNEPLGIGLWFSASCAEQLASAESCEALKGFLHELQLVPFTFNGFPYGDFHQSVVKQKVYLPTWANPKRLEYTLRLAEIQSRLLKENSEGSISTLPIGWPQDGFSKFWNPGDHASLEAATKNLLQCAEGLHRLFETTGQRIRLAIEPEPGCLIDNKDAVVRFFDEYLLKEAGANADQVLEYIGVCHDICHSAVMFEPQEEALRTYAAHKIRVVKVQVSSAIEVCFDELSKEDSELAVRQLAGFTEDRYLHQTCVKIGEEVQFCEDLPVAIRRSKRAGVWRVHFHVPLFAESFGRIGTTQDDVRECLRLIESTHPLTRHFEVETYAWNVLPEALCDLSLADGISRELDWFCEAV